jgi:dipeptidyl aminopeptidase/acylaminoacyl peptidase
MPSVRRHARPLARAAVLLCAASLLTAGAALAQGAKRPMSLDDIMALKQVGAPSISPDGKLVTYTVGGWEHPQAKGDSAKGDVHEVRSHVWLVATDGSAPARQLTFSERGESAPQFSPDGGTIAFLSARGSSVGGNGPTPQIWLLRLAGGEAEQLTSGKAGAGAFTWSPDGRSIAFVTSDSTTRDDDAKRARRDDPQQFEGDARLTHAWVVDVATKKARELTHSTEWTVAGGPQWSPDGTRLTINTHPTTLIRDERRGAYIVDVATGRLTPVAGVPAVQATPAWSPDGKQLAFTTLVQSHSAHADGMMEREQRSTHVTVYDVATGKATDLYDPKQFDEDANGLKWAADGKGIYFNATDRVWGSVYHLDLAARAYHKLTQKQLVAATAFSKDGARVAFTLSSAASPANVYVADASFASPRQLTNANPQLAEIALGETEVITWKSSDGQEVEGVLLKPVGYQPGQRVPMLVEPHGGPTGAHNAGFKASNGSPGQYWAGKGWATFYPNPRGSTGYGEKFMRGNIMDWGGGDYRDIMTGVDAVIAKGVADPDKLAVAGWSYGGYMTSWVVSQTTRFKAARMGAGLSNLESMYGTTDIPGYIGAFFSGPPTKETLAKYRERSAMTYIDQVKTPTLILHGAQDARVPIGQPMEFYRGMKDRGVPTELWFYPREGHGFSEYYHQLDKMKREYEWIARYTLGAKVLQ